MKYFLYVLLCFLYIFGPVFNSIGPLADTIFIVSFALFFYNFLFYKNLIPAYSRIFFILFPVFFYGTFLITLYPGVVPSDYLQVLLKPIRIIITLLGGFSLMILLHKRYKNDSFNVLVEMIFYSIVLHSIIMLFQFYNKDFKDFVYLYTTTGEFRSSFEYDFRMGGLSGTSGGPILSVVQSMGILILPFILKNSSKIKKIVTITLGLLIIHSILICGRSGLWSLVLFFPLSIYLVNGKMYISTIVKIFLYISILVISLSVLVNFTIKIENPNPLKYSLTRTLSTFINYGETGNFEDETVNTLVKHILLPSDVSTLIFGNGKHIVDRGFNRTLNSDIGYIKNLWGFGIIAFFIYLLPLLKYLFISFRHRKAYASAALLFLVSVIMLFFHLKELFLYGRMLFSMYSLSIACFFIYKGSNVQRYNLKQENFINEAGKH